MLLWLPSPHRKVPSLSSDFHLILNLHKAPLFCTVKYSRQISILSLRSLNISYIKAQLKSNIPACATDKLLRVTRG